MANSTLSKLLDLLEESQGALSFQSLAQELEVTQARVKGMVDYWIRKGKIKASATLTDCGSCGVLENCPFVLDLPKTYELVNEVEANMIEVVHPGCNCK
jgi:hypothetical protein